MGLLFITAKSHSKGLSFLTLLSPLNIFSFPTRLTIKYADDIYKRRTSEHLSYTINWIWETGFWNFKAFFLPQSSPDPSLSLMTRLIFCVSVSPGNRVERHRGGLGWKWWLWWLTSRVNLARSWGTQIFGWTWFLGVSVRLFPDETSIWVRLSKADCPP